MTGQRIVARGSDPQVRHSGGVRYRDLAGTGRMEPYQDPRLPAEARVADLLARMTLPEKAGLLFHTMLKADPDGLYEPGPDCDDIPHDVLSTHRLIEVAHINHFNAAPRIAPRQYAEWHNRVQWLAAQTRLGIPVTLSTDPVHGFVDNPATSVATTTFSRWPEALGLAATGDPELVAAYADVVRREYLAVGIRMSLGPQADLATEPRWSRLPGTFGADADLAGALVAAYIRGMQGERLGPRSVACMTKHFPGAGPQLDGWDAHFPYGREQVYPGGNLAYHLRPFEAAFAAGTAAVMPYYAIPVGLGVEEVGFGFNREVITGWLRERYGYDGVICSDWGLVTDVRVEGTRWPARCWGAEDLSRIDRVHRVLSAGVDQLGGEFCPELVVELVEAGRLDVARIDASARRILRDKFLLGLFDDPYVDPDEAERVVGRADFAAAGVRAQQRAVTLLANGPLPGRATGAGAAPATRRPDGVPVEGSGPAPDDSPAEGSGPAPDDSPAEGSGPAPDDSPAENSGPAPDDGPAEGSGPAPDDGPAEGSGPLVLPLRRGIRMFLDGIDPAVAARYGTVVPERTGADVALVRLAAPYEQRNTGIDYEAGFHQGRLDLPLERVAELVERFSEAPTVLVVFLDRAAVLPEVIAASAAALAEFGVTDDALLGVLFGEAAPGGRLPMELPSSMEAVEKSREDVPNDTADPLFPAGHGLRY